MTASRYVTAIPEPDETLRSLRDSVVALKSNVEVLTQQRKPRSAAAVTFQDLVDLGVITADQIPS